MAKKKRARQLILTDERFFEIIEKYKDEIVQAGKDMEANRKKGLPPWSSGFIFLDFLDKCESREEKAAIIFHIYHSATQAGFNLGRTGVRADQLGKIDKGGKN